ncbi:MAG: geranylgeranylglyceryl/heptaprenylglyceryl phosphate synthase [Gemmatimonadaceae bacterium]
MTILAHLSAHRGLAVLIDPSRTTAAQAVDLAARAADEGVVALLVGTSYGNEIDVSAVARAVKQGAPNVPLLEFPGAASHLVPDVDGVLLLSLVSGRNAQYLIEEHVRAVPFFERHPHVEPISTAYVLIDGGEVTSVEAVSQTRPLPANKPELVAAHVRAAMLVGMSATYLDAGSGARRPVAPSLIRAARAATRGPLFVGGGLRTPDAVRAAREAGADVIVVGTLLERQGAPAVRELALAART